MEFDKTKWFCSWKSDQTAQNLARGYTGVGCLGGVTTSANFGFQ